MLGRVQRLEQKRGGDDGGAFDAFVSECEAGVAAGRLDGYDIPIILACLRRWRSHYGVSFGPARRRSR